MSTAHFLMTAWVWSPLGIACATVAMVGCVARAGWSRRAWWMVAAVALLLVALMSPLAALAQGYLFSAHMAQHIILLLIVPALALLALPESTSARRLNPVFAWLGGVGAMWIWHTPALCDAAATSRSVSAVQTLSLLAMGGAFWWPLLAPRDRLAPLAGIAYLFAACAACTVLGIILTFSPVTVCRAYLAPVDRLGILPLIYGQWGMTPARDQQAGGLIMWVPMCMVYLGAIFGQLARWYGARPILNYE